MPDISQPWWQFLLRAGHLLAGIVWIGLTYYFNLIQSEYFREAVPDARVDMIKKLVPLSLSWSRMAALFTFLSGVLLMFTSGEPSGGLSLDIAVGALLGTLMFLNVWFVIWPKHRIACGLAVGDAAVAGPRAQLASRTNVVFSLAMLLFMTSAAHLPGVALRDAGQMALEVIVVIIGVVEANTILGRIWPPMLTVRGLAGCTAGFALLLWTIVRLA